MKKTSAGGEDGLERKAHKFDAPVPFYSLPMEHGLTGSTSLTGLTESSESSQLKAIADIHKEASVMVTAFGLSILDSLEAIYIERVSGLPFTTEMSISSCYVIYDKDGNPIFFAGENIDCGSNSWRGMQRRYCIYVFSVLGELLYTIERQRLRCCSRKPPTQEAVASNIYNVAELSELRLANTRIHLAKGEFIGQVRDSSTDCTPRFQIDDENYSNIFKILGKCPGSWCPLLACNNSKFPIRDPRHNIVGHIFKGGSSGENRAVIPILKNCLGANFPKDLSPITKALIIAAVFDLDISLFHRKFSLDMLVYILTVIWILALFVFSILLLLWASKVIQF